MKTLLLLSPMVGACLGWLSVEWAIRLIFRPLRPIKFFGFNFQGFLPARRNEIAIKIAALAGSEAFFSSGALEEKISSPESFEKILPVVEAQIDDFLRVKLSKAMPMISMFIGDRTILQLKTIFMTELQELFPVVMKQYAGNLKQDLDIEKMIKEKLDAISMEQIEGAFLSGFGTQLKKIKVTAAALGLSIGLIQLLLLYLLH